MTRLTTADIRCISDDFPSYESDLKSKTGCSLRQIACIAAGLREEDIQRRLGRICFGVIPISSGKGVLNGFCDTVATIVEHIGFKAIVTKNTDVSGIAEVVKRHADILMLADDDCFLALDLYSRKTIDNAVATGMGFAVALQLAAGGLADKDALVIGCGPVGESSVRTLIGAGARVSIFDIDSLRCSALVESIHTSMHKAVHIAEDLDMALYNKRFIVDASPAAGIIQARHITPETYISAPGVPIGLDQEALTKIGDKLLHDPLQIGVATMAVAAAKAHVLSG